LGRVCGQPCGNGYVELIEDFRRVHKPTNVDDIFDSYKGVVSEQSFECDRGIDVCEVVLHLRIVLELLGVKVSPILEFSTGIFENRFVSFLELIPIGEKEGIMVGRIKGYCRIELPIDNSCDISLFVDEDVRIVQIVMS
jgi:hypothetical protein